MGILPAIGHTHAREVVYSDEAHPDRVEGTSPRLDKLLEDGGGDLLEGLRLHMRAYADELFFRKLTDWKSEREYRYVVHDTDALDTTIAMGSSLRAVIVGEGFPVWQLAGAAEVCRSRAAELRQIPWGAFPPGVFDPLAASR